MVLAIYVQCVVALGLMGVVDGQPDACLVFRNRPMKCFVIGDPTLPVIDSGSAKDVADVMKCFS